MRQPYALAMPAQVGALIPTESLNCVRAKHSPCESDASPLRVFPVNGTLHSGCAEGRSPLDTWPSSKSEIPRGCRELSPPRVWGCLSSSYRCHCEERSDAAISGRGLLRLLLSRFGEWLAMTGMPAADFAVLYPPYNGAPYYPSGRAERRSPRLRAISHQLMAHA
jgi:hypothetical protein